MKQALIACAAGALLVAPGAIAKPDQADRTNAAKECRAERGSTDATLEAFRARYGTGKNAKNAFGKCVSSTSKEEESERGAATKNAAKECKAERDAGATAFTKKNAKNAFGKCVSSKAKEDKAEEDQEDAKEAVERKNAAKECDSERAATGKEAFAAKYGTNANKRNAFGKCVSQTASA